VHGPAAVWDAAYVRAVQAFRRLDACPTNAGSSRSGAR